ncbi:MAG: Ig-like domain-containing protein [Lachnospiraceae bacterium]|nr:Ig-like domain-containing protein [Lachnospiraceae bacterium]
MKQNKIQMRKGIVFFVFFFLLLLGVILPAKNIYADVVLNKTELTLEVGKSQKLKLAGTNKKIRWSSNKASVAKVSNKGTVTAISKGNAVITAKAGKKKYTCKVCVYDVNYSNAKVAKKAKKVIKKYIKASMNTEEKILAIHDYMVLNCAYDYKNYLKGTIPFVSYSPEGVLIKKKAVCQGYAETFQLFMDSLGIPCKLVTGTANGGGHAWNMVKVSGKWFQIDVTWDDPVPDAKGRTRYAYFLIPDSVMDNDHKWNKSYYPKCKTKSDKFIHLFGEVSKSKEEAIQNLYEQYRTGNKMLTLIYTKKCWNSLEGSKIPFFEMQDLYGLNADGHTSYSYSHYEYGKYVVIYVYL